MTAHYGPTPDPRPLTPSEHYASRYIEIEAGVEDIPADFPFTRAHMMRMLFSAGAAEHGDPEPRP